VGLGNIGAAAADLMARMGLAEITLIDQGAYERKNVTGQAIDQTAVGRPKVDVIAERLRRINPDLVVRPIHARLQDVPLGLLRENVDVMVCALDNRLARSYANQATRQLGIATLIDAGVEPSQLLARVNVHRSDSSSSCLQCGWSDEDYNLIESRNPCQQEDTAPSTNAPAALGALAASMLTIELKKLIDGDLDHLAAGKQITFCALTHKLFVTAIGPNRHCRCDHVPWRLTTLKPSPERFTLGEALRLGQTLSVPGKTFVRALVCRDCGARRKLLRLEGRFSRRQLTCSRCDASMIAPGFDQLDRLDVNSLDAESPWLRRPLAALGIVEGDILSLGTTKGERHFEVRSEVKRPEVLHA
jgi:molybdopterin/thiamine biosynthesis adenylyltransferase